MKGNKVLKKTLEILRAIIVYAVLIVLIYNFNDFTWPLIKLWLMIMGLALYVFVVMFIPLFIVYKILKFGFYVFS